MMLVTVNRNGFDLSNRDLELISTIVNQVAEENYLPAQLDSCLEVKILAHHPLQYAIGTIEFQIQEKGIAIYSAVACYDYVVDLEKVDTSELDMAAVKVTSLEVLKL